MKKYLCFVPLVVLFCFTIACQDKAAMAELRQFKAQNALETQNIELIRKLLGEISNRNAAVFNELYAPDYKYYFPSVTQTPFSREEEAAQVKAFFSAFPDLTNKIVDIFAVKDRVIVRVIVSGTHQAEFDGIPATGKKSELSAIVIFRLRDGKVVEAFEEGDFLGLYQKLGLELKPIEIKK